MPRFDKDGKPEIKRSTGPYGWNTIQKNGEKYMTRIWLGRLRLHVFFKGDDDRDPHDHPWSFTTFPFSPYVEEVTEKVITPVWVGPERIIANYDSDGEATYLNLHTMSGGWEDQITYRKRLQVVPAWRWNKRPAEHCHRVLGPFTGQYHAFNPQGKFVGEVSERERVSGNRYRIFERYGYTLVPQYAPFADRTLVTLVWRSGFTRMWGFLKTRDGKWCWQDFKSYLNDNGGSAPCE